MYTYTYTVCIQTPRSKEAAYCNYNPVVIELSATDRYTKYFRAI